MNTLADLEWKPARSHKIYYEGRLLGSRVLARVRKNAFGFRARCSLEIWNGRAFVDVGTAWIWEALHAEAADLPVPLPTDFARERYWNTILRPRLKVLKAFY